MPVHSQGIATSVVATSIASASAYVTIVCLCVLCTSHWHPDSEFNFQEREMAELVSPALVLLIWDGNGPLLGRARGPDDLGYARP